MRNEDMTAEDVYGLALHNAICMGFGQNAEDIAQEVVLNRLRGVGKNQHMRYSVLDAAHHMGLSHSSKYRVLGKEHRTIANPELLKHLESPEGALSGLDTNRMVRGLPSRDRAIFLLYFEWGFMLWEVAEIFGVSESRASQKIEEIVRTVKQNLVPLSEEDDASCP